MVKRSLLVATLLLAALTSACSNPVAPTPAAPARVHLKAGQDFIAAFLQSTRGQAGSELLDSDFAATLHFHVTSVDASGVATLNVSTDHFSAATANSEPIDIPTPFQFTLDAQGQVLAGHAWPLLGAIATLPALDQFCMPLPTAPLEPGLAWSAPLNRGALGRLDGTASDALSGYPATLDSTAHTTFAASDSSGGITSSSSGSADQALTCHFDPVLGHPVGLQSQISFQVTQTAALTASPGAPPGPPPQTTTATGTIVTTLDYKF
jgi:hypothetical protein